MLTGKHSDVSVVIAAYNAGRWIGETLDSLLNQTYRDFEILIIDDGSTDDTASIVAGYGKAVRYLHKANGGQPTARNAGIRASCGKYIAFVDADDLWRPDKLDLQMRLFAADPDLAWAYSDAYTFDSHTGAVLARVGGRLKLTDGDILRQLLLSNFIPSPTPVIRRSVFEEVGYFNESPDMRIGEDWDMWLRIAAKYPVGFVDLPLALIRRHAASMTTSMNLQLSLRGKLAIIEQAVKRNGLRLIDLEKKAMANVYNATAEAMLARGVDRHTTRALFRKSLALNPARLGPVFGLMLSMVPRHVFACLYAIRRRVAQRRRTDVAGWNK